MNCYSDNCHDPVTLGIRLDNDDPAITLMCEAHWQKHCADSEKRWRKKLYSKWSDDPFYTKYLNITLGVA